MQILTFILFFTSVSLEPAHPLLPINKLGLQAVNCRPLNPNRNKLDRFHGSRMEGFLSTFPPYNVYGNPGGAPPAPDGSWGKREGRFMIPQGLNYLELCKAILSQVNPSLPLPPLKKANTKECGVQVNAKVDKVVQCSLGPKTLFCDDHPASFKSPQSPDLFTPDGKAQCHTPPVSNLRFFRPVSIYSPVFDRRLFQKWLDDDCGSEVKSAEASERAESDADQYVDDPEKESKPSFRQSSKGSSFQVGFRVKKSPENIKFPWMNICLELNVHLEVSLNTTVCN